MLDRILNINPQEKYKSGLKINTHHIAVNRHDQEKHNSKDSALFSPLAQLLSKINWKILNIEFPSNDEILFNFLVNDFEFITVINFSEMYESVFQEFSIFKMSKNNNAKYQTEVKLKVKKEKIKILENPDPIITDNISYLFDRLIRNNEGQSKKIIESGILKDYVTGFESQLYEEFDYILRVIYTFISTRFKSRVKNNFVLKTQENIPIIMQKVAIICAD